MLEVGIEYIIPELQHRRCLFSQNAREGTDLQRDDWRGRQDLCAGVTNAISPTGA